MKVTTPASAGTMESGDIYVEIEQTEQEGITVELDSTVGSQFGTQIIQVIQRTLTECGIARAQVKAVDKGALDCTIQARVTAAAYRAAGRDDYQWR